jgi:hypothetical protein
MDADLTEQSYSAYRGPAMSIKEKGKCQCTCKVCVEGGKCHKGKHTWKYTTIYCQQYNGGLCLRGLL